MKNKKGEYIANHSKFRLDLSMERMLRIYIYKKKSEIEATVKMKTFSLSPFLRTRLQSDHRICNYKDTLPRAFLSAVFYTTIGLSPSRECVDLQRDRSRSAFRTFAYMRPLAYPISVIPPRRSFSGHPRP